ncbi:16S rRNA (cytosine(967)-C(5))-methyltransferase [Endozoicomonas sp. OPT23]|uniref:16S rRNA (cytosine(967)-C(5))-methyltransferase RsmB n=1 Tax=Endozoicomonas sp. OPT23 TaxID=2072845 RepID=UPI00129B1790|nr:16S rRNA (cytosine(967)-C(5))-methyltransferase RsmB [Endozoicomonas sp. OPT23]MRI33378.1 16S rRNA (cytosine(967)-C(5))-methyltransferase [Endozoicomonas sp. OPT23]
MAKQSSVRLAAAKVVSRVVAGDSLNQALPVYQDTLGKKDQPLLAELCYGTLRYYFRLDAWLGKLMDKPLKTKEKDIHSLMLVGLYQLFYTRIPAHAAIGETVQVTRTLGKAWARGLVNGVLRNAQRQEQELKEFTETDDISLTAHPQWLLGKIKKAWPDYWQNIAAANNSSPPMTIRVNEQHVSRNRYLKKLLEAGISANPSVIAPQGITLTKAQAVDNLPGFFDGVSSVQDESAQLSGNLLKVKAGDRVLDACCAPGGKTCQLLEINPEIELQALDVDEKRLTRVQENLERIGLRAKLMAGDGCEPDVWWDGEQYDHILLDAPCSATGVIRRHPDIKLLRKPEDIDALAELQGRILETMWSLLKPGGTLLYATCSIMPAENSKQIERFLAKEECAELQAFEGDWGLDTGFGRQILPGSGDGFFYALLRKGC